MAADYRAGPLDGHGAFCADRRFDRGHCRRPTISMMWLASAAPQPRSTLGDEGLLTMKYFTAAPLSVRTLTLATAAIAALALLEGMSSPSGAQSAGSGAPVVEFPTVDPARGRELFVSKGGTRAHERTRELLRIPSRRDRMSPALRVAYDLRVAGCDDKASLFERAAEVGDGRVLEQLQILAHQRCTEGNRGQRSTLCNG